MIEHRQVATTTLQSIVMLSEAKDLLFYPDYTSSYVARFFCGNTTDATTEMAITPATVPKATAVGTS